MSVEPISMEILKSEENFTSARRNPASVYIIGLAKLLVHGVILMLFSGKLAEWKVFGQLQSNYASLAPQIEKLTGFRPTVQLFFLLSICLYSALYMLTLAVLRIRNQTGYLYYSMFFVFDVVFLMQPSKTLLLYLMALLLLITFRLNHTWRYLLAAGIIAVFSLITEPLLLALIPLFSLALTMRRKEKLCFVLFIVYLIGFSVLYQFDYLPDLVGIRENSTSPTTFPLLFPEEEMQVHVSYYLINTLIIIGRILLPVELLWKSSLHSLAFLAVQLGALVLYVRAFRYLLDLDWESEVKKEDRILHDATNLIFCYIIVLAVSQPDLGECFRQLVALTPLYLYLMFEATYHQTQPQANRQFADTCPVIFYHVGKEPYLYEVLARARKVCGPENVILLGDEQNKGFTSNWFSADDYGNAATQQFFEKYLHLSHQHSARFELTCFYRHFAIADFCRKQGIRHCYVCDSDVLLYRNPAELTLSDYDFACISTEGGAPFGEHCAPHFMYWKLDSLLAFEEFCLRIYSSQTNWLNALAETGSEQSGLAPTDVNDALLLTAWKQITMRYQPDFRFCNLLDPQDGSVFDLGTGRHEAATGDFRYSRLLGCKSITFREGTPYFTTTNGEQQAAAMLHVQTLKELYIPLFAACKNGKLRYLLRRIASKLCP